MHWRPVPHYFFDTRDDKTFIEDDVGLDLPNLEEAKVQAARSLAELARDVLPSSVRRDLAVEVREGAYPLLKTLLHFEAVYLRK